MELSCTLRPELRKIPAVTVFYGKCCRKALPVPEEHGLSVCQFFRKMDRNWRGGTLVYGKYQEFRV